MTLLVSGKEVGSNKLLVAFGHIALEYHLRVVCIGSVNDLELVYKSDLTVQSMSLEVLGARVQFVASGKVAAEPPRCTFPAGALVAGGLTAPSTRVWLYCLHQRSEISWSGEGHGNDTPA
jgi:hypothetical protein